MTKQTSKFFGVYPPTLPVEEFEGLFLTTERVSKDDGFVISQIVDNIETARVNAAKTRPAQTALAVGEDEENELGADEKPNTTLGSAVTSEHEMVFFDILAVYRTRSLFWAGMVHPKSPRGRRLKTVARAARLLKGALTELTNDEFLADDVAFDRQRIVIDALGDIASARSNDLDEETRALADRLKARLLSQKAALQRVLPRRHFDLAFALTSAASADDFKSPDESSRDAPALELVVNLTIWWKDVTGADPVFSDKGGPSPVAGKSSPYIIFMNTVFGALPVDVRLDHSRGHFGVTKSALARRWQEYQVHVSDLHMLGGLVDALQHNAASDPIVE